jgi:endo-1,4-beta-xylanase
MKILFLHVMLWLPLAALAAEVPAEAVPALKDVFKDDFLIGVAVGPYVYQGKDKDIGGLVARHFNSLTCENAMKWASVNPTPGVYTFEVADRLVEFAEAHGMRVVGHTLVWEQQTPDWVFKGPDGKEASRELLVQRMREHIAKVVGRYRGKLKGWDVVNEAVAGGGTGVLDDSPWKRIIGEDYVAMAYEYAHQADPRAELYYNEYGLEDPAKRARTIRLVKGLLDKGIKIHAVGNQAHWGLGNPPVAEIEKTIKEFSALGVKVNFTELDINLYQGNDKTDIYQNGAPAEVLNQQAARYAEIFALFHKYRQHIERVTFWGPTDQYSWLNQFPIKRTNHPLLFDRAGLPKPAFRAVVVGKK